MLTAHGYRSTTAPQDRQTTQFGLTSRGGRRIPRSGNRDDHAEHDPEDGEGSGRNGPEPEPVPALDRDGELLASVRQPLVPRSMAGVILVEKIVRSGGAAGAGCPGGVIAWNRSTKTTLTGRRSRVARARAT